MKRRRFVGGAAASLAGLSNFTALSQTSDATLTVDPRSVVRPVPPGVVGWGGMWKRDMLWPSPPASFPDDQSHTDYIIRLGETNAPLINQADVRNISWPWGVSFSTWAVNWENSARPWSQRPSDCARFLNRTSPWCEKTIVGVGDLMTLAHIWNLEAITVSVPLAVIDGRNVRWGPGFFDQVFSPDVIEKISDHAKLLVDYMKYHTTWNRLERVFLSAGCEWRHYKLRNPSPAVLSYAALVKRIREKISDDKVIIVASASDSADLPGIERTQANSWNQYLYENLNGIRGVALDLHRYRGMIGAEPGPGGAMPLTPRNTDVLLRTGLSQREHLTVTPKHWGGRGSAMPTVLLENAIHGVDGDHSKTTDQERPWPVALAHADLVREALAGEALTFLGWAWFPENLPREWPHGALRDGQLATHAQAQGFLSHFHRGQVVQANMSNEQAVRANAVRDGNSVRVYGGNFSRAPSSLQLNIQNQRSWRATLEVMTDSGVRNQTVDSGKSISLPPLSLFRMKIA